MLIGRLLANCGSDGQIGTPGASHFIGSFAGKLSQALQTYMSRFLNICQRSLLCSLGKTDPEVLMHCSSCSC